VLIANRGEIAERVMHTCRKLGIETVAIYSTADAQSRFVGMADQKVCVGPPAASESYLNVDAVLKAIKDTGAQAVHPGYGFLSENAQFAESITQQAGAVWLGPPTYAVQQMGDKLMSKVVAREADVTTIPGLDDDFVHSVEHALQVCNEIVGYPVLLKAVAGGGGKGMRVCYSDKDIKEAWGIAKSEALKFFSDDRLLIEKYIEKPHHIEFQVLCAPGKAKDEKVEVCVFPERECSIQRRNQKVIEETPSCLLRDDTRAEMASQVERLCQAVGYESAGTVEFLVDENQNFYFLEMNTRLQVEHPVSEAVCGVDLVKGMLWVGAGWGFPPEFLTREGRTHGGLILPHRGHAVEARVYAEDPLRGFLPSTGPLSTYVEPSMARNTPDSYLRMDSGVTAGHLVSPYYDPMISKIVYYAQTRKEAIAGLSQALDEYVIEGVRHNARLVQSVLRHPSFVAGDTPTSFLPTHYPDGFAGVQLNPDEECEYVVAAAAIGAKRREMLRQPPLEFAADDGDGHVDSAANDPNSAVVKLGGMFGRAYLVKIGEESATVKLLGEGNEDVVADEEREVIVRLDSRAPLVYEPEKFLAHLTLNGKCRTLQVLQETTTGEVPMQMFGCDRQVLIQSFKEHQLSKHMHVPLQVDTTNLVQSPMPGTLISFAVAEGDSVEIGQELCIVEAMKMQNIIRAPRAGVVKTLKVDVGGALKNDEVILEFEGVEDT